MLDLLKRIAEWRKKKYVPSNELSESVMLDLLKRIAEWRKKKYVPSNELEIRWTDFHISIVRCYSSNLSMIFNFPDLPSAAKLRINEDPWDPNIVASFTRELQELFVVPIPNKFHESRNRINEYQLVEAFIGFLLQLLYHKPDSAVNPLTDRIQDVEKELRFLHTFLGDTSLMQCDEHEEFQKFLPEFEAVANGAGRLVRTIFFSIGPTYGATGEEVAVVLNHMDHLKANLIKFLNLWPSIRRSACITPNTSVVDSFLIVDSLIHDLEDLMKREDNRITDVKEQIKLLHQELILLKFLIKDTGSPRPSEMDELKEPLMRIGDTAREAEYLVTSFLVGDAPLWYFITRLTDLNHKIEFIGIELQEITNKYKFGGLRVADYFSYKPFTEAKRYTEVDDVTIGFREKELCILDQLVGRGTEPLQVISVFGMPGIGKTTLAKKLYNHPSVNYFFDKQAWAVVSQNYIRKNTLADILIHLKSELGKDEILNMEEEILDLPASIDILGKDEILNMEEEIFDLPASIDILGKDEILNMEEEILVEYIYKTLKGRRYLIFIDDVWELDVWDDMRRCFPDDGNGSRILLTSRIKDVAPSNGIIHEMPFLLDEQCWELLEKKVFGGRPCPPELQEIGKRIASKCCGLPLTVVVIAGILSTVDKEESTWEEVGRDLTSYIDGGDDSVMRILELSYKHLPDHLKPCFLHFGIFEEDKQIPTGDLMRFWISEGFIRKENEKSAETIAQEYLIELIDKSLVMVAKRRSDGGVKSCVIHDLLRELCLKRSKEENFLKILKSNYQTMHEKGHGVRALQDSITLSCCQHARSFYGDNQRSPFYVRDMKLLRVLHFNPVPTCGIFGIEYLHNLRYLVIWDLPASIDILVNLEYLRVLTRTTTIYLAPAVVKMKKLRYFKAAFTEYGEDWNSSQENNLEFLSVFTVNKLKDEEMLRHLPHLRRLKCRYELQQWEKTERPHFDLQFLSQLVSLHLEFLYFVNSSSLEELRFPKNIRKLTFSGSRFPWEKMSMIGSMENLEVLKITDDAFCGERWDTRGGEFQSLTFLKLHGLNLTQWNVDSSEHFPKLQQLVLSYCTELQEIPSEIGEVTTLQLIKVKAGCRTSLVESAERIRQEQCEMGNEELRVIYNVTSCWDTRRGRNRRTSPQNRAELG